MMDEESFRQLDLHQSKISKIGSREATVRQADRQAIGWIGGGMHIDGRNQGPLFQFHQSESGFVAGVMQLANEVDLQRLESDSIRLGVQAAGEEAQGD